MYLVRCQTHKPFSHSAAPKLILELLSVRRRCCSQGAEQQLQDHTERTGQTVRWWSCSIRCSESIWLLTLEGVRRVSHGSRSGAPSRRKAAAERGGQVSVENCCFFLAPLTDLSKVRSRAARQPSQRPQWAAAADGRCRPYGLISPPLYPSFTRGIGRPR